MSSCSPVIMTPCVHPTGLQQSSTTGLTPDIQVSTTPHHSVTFLTWAWLAPPSSATHTADLYPAATINALDYLIIASIHLIGLLSERFSVSGGVFWWQSWVEIPEPVEQVDRWRPSSFSLLESLDDVAIDCFFFFPDPRDNRSASCQSDGKTVIINYINN